MRLHARAPVRIDFGGAWTDVDRYAKTHGGAVVNATIDRFVHGTFDLSSIGDGVGASEGLRVEYGFELPSGSGLGTSAALNLVWLALVTRAGADTPLSVGDRLELARKAFAIEAVLGILGGRQDQCASALGGFQHLTFGESVGATPVRIDVPTLEALQSRSVLCYTGTPRLSGGIHESVWGAYDAGRRETVDALHGLRAIGFEQPALLESGDLDAFANSIARNWTLQKRLDDSVTNADIERLMETATRSGALGGKACGAGGGGCLYFVTRDPDATRSVKKSLADAGAKLIDFAFEPDGLRVTREP